MIGNIKTESGFFLGKSVSRRRNAGRVANRTFPLLFAVSAGLALFGWLFCFYPWFGLIEQHSFFCFLPEYIRPFWARPGGPAELAARFLVQFFYLPWGAAAVHGLLVAALAHCAFYYARMFTGLPQALSGDSGIPIVSVSYADNRRSGYGRAVFSVGILLAVYWIFAYESLRGFTLAVSWVLNIGLVWMALRLSKRVFFPLLAVVAYYLTGPMSVFYVLAVSVFRPARLLSGIPAVLLAAVWSVSYLIYPWQDAVGYTLVRENLPVQNRMLLLAAVSAAVGILLQSLVFRVKDRRKAGRRSEVGRMRRRIDAPCRPFPYKAIPLSMLCWGVLWIWPCLYAADPVERTFGQCKKYASEGAWDEVFRRASLYFEKHPEPARTSSDRQLRYRELLAVDLKLALLKSGRLNTHFFSYGSIPEMNLFMEGYTLSGNYNLPAARFAWETGMFVPMRIYLNNILNVHGVQNGTLQLIIPNSIFLQRYELASNYIYYQSNTLFYRKEARYWQAYNGPEESWRHPYIARQRIVNNARIQEEGFFLDSWAQMLYTSQSDKDLLEYYTFLQLFYKKMDSLPALAAHYRRSGYRVLPSYLQEGLLIMQDYNPTDKNMPRTYSDFPYSPSVLSDYRRAYADARLFRAGKLDLATLAARHGSAYFFHYYFRSFIYR